MKLLASFAAFLFLTLPLAAQDASKLVFIPASQLQSDIHSAPPNSSGVFSINLIENAPDHTAILARRTGPGKVEVHEKQADVIYVVDGACTFVTGGTVVDPSTSGPGEIRGSSINGGEERQLAKGDFIRIPAGVPHWVKKIDGSEFVYFVVKYGAK